MLNDWVTCHLQHIGFSPKFGHHMDSLRENEFFWRISSVINRCPKSWSRTQGLIKCLIKNWTTKKNIMAQTYSAILSNILDVTSKWKVPCYDRRWHDNVSVMLGSNFVALHRKQLYKSEKLSNGRKTAYNVPTYFLNASFWYH